MAGPHTAATAAELHHRIPRCLLRLYDRADRHPDFDGEGIELWLEFTHEASRYGVAGVVSREDLAALVEASTVLLGRHDHRHEHESDWQRWGRWGGQTTFRRYGSAWFALLAKRRWGRAPAEVLKAEISALRAA